MQKPNPLTIDLRNYFVTREEYNEFINGRLEALERLVLKPKEKLFRYTGATVEVKGTNFHTAISDDWVRPNALIDWLNSLPLKIDESENE